MNGPPTTLPGRNPMGRSCPVALAQIALAVGAIIAITRRRP